jgi:K+-sensing histidine kinase KdpD
VQRNLKKSAARTLGLARAARAIGLHAGSIEARNLAGGGLAVVITLPAADRARLPDSLGASAAA